MTTDGAKRCRACRRDQAKKRKLRDVEQAAALMDKRFLEPDPDPSHDFELPLGTLGRKWIKSGQCVLENVDPAWFFEPLLEDETASYCEGCSVINLCFAFAVVGGEKGVWGGTTEKQRDLLSLSQRLTIRQGYPKMYAEYWDEGLELAPRHFAPAPLMPKIEEAREQVIMRAMEASEYETVAGLAGFDNVRFGNRARLEEAHVDGVQS